MVSGRELRKLEGRTDNVSCVAVTPDGQRIITGSWDSTVSTAGNPDGTARIWDAVSGRELLTLKPLQGHTGPVQCIVVTPDGQRIVTGNYDGTARLWDKVSGRELRTLKGHTGPVFSVAVTSDGRRLVTGSQDGTARVCDEIRGRELLVLKGHTNTVNSVAVTPDGERIVTGSWDGTARVWDGVSGRELLSLLGHVEPGMSVAVTPDGRRLVTGNGDGTVAVWDAVTGRELLTLKGHTGPVRFVAVTSDGRRLITGSDDGTVKIWEAASPEQVALWTRQEQEAARQQAIWQRPVAGVPGFIQDWLVLAPLGLAPGERGSVKGVEREQIRGEAKLQPRAGDRAPVVVWSGDHATTREYTWQVLHEQEPLLDFNRFVGKLSRFSDGYAVCYVISAAGARTCFCRWAAPRKPSCVSTARKCTRTLGGVCSCIRPVRSPCSKGRTYWSLKW